MPARSPVLPFPRSSVSPFLSFSVSPFLRFSVSPFPGSPVPLSPVPPSRVPPFFRFPVLPFPCSSLSLNSLFFRSLVLPFSHSPVLPFPPKTTFPPPPPKKKNAESPATPSGVETWLVPYNDCLPASSYLSPCINVTIHIENRHDNKINFVQHLLYRYVIWISGGKLWRERKINQVVSLWLKAN